MLKRQIPTFAVVVAVTIGIYAYRTVFADKPPVRLETSAVGVLGTPVVHVKATNATASVLRGIQLRIRVPMKDSRLGYVQLKPSHVGKLSANVRVTSSADALLLTVPELAPGNTVEVILTMSNIELIKLGAPALKTSPQKSMTANSAFESGRAEEPHVLGAYSGRRAAQRER